MGEPAIDPVRVFVGLDSAPTEEERVQLAIAELERTGAFDRELMIAVSPTGTGYVNYVAIACAEAYTLGNCATVTLQYSKRPSPMSLDRVWEGRKHFKMLLAAIRRKLYNMTPSERPRLVVFGESLGAHTSQDAFLDTGTQGLQDAGVERALWIGTPHLSKWKKQVMAGGRMDVEPEKVGEFNSFADVEALSQEARSKLRYFMITHGNDGVGHFDPTLLIQKPDWLGDPDTRPPGVPKSERYVTPLTFVQTLIDMKNAMGAGPGEFVADGHDYRADLPRFVLEAFGLTCSARAIRQIEERPCATTTAAINEWLTGHVPERVFEADWRRPASRRQRRAPDRDRSQCRTGLAVTRSRWSPPSRRQISRLTASFRKSVHGRSRRTSRLPVALLALAHAAGSPDEERQELSNWRRGVKVGLCVGVPIGTRAHAGAAHPAGTAFLPRRTHRARPA